MGSIANMQSTAILFIPNFLYALSSLESAKPFHYEENEGVVMAAQATFFIHFQGPYAVLLGSQAICVEALQILKGPFRCVLSTYFCIAMQKKFPRD